MGGSVFHCRLCTVLPGIAVWIALCLGLGTTARAEPPTNNAILREVRIEVPFGGKVSWETAANIAKAAAYLKALNDVTGTLSNNKAAQLAASSPEQERALASAIFPVALEDIPPVALDKTGEGKVVAIARVPQSLKSLDTAVREALRSPDNLELRLLALQDFSTRVTEGMDLLERSRLNRQLAGSAPGHASDDPFVPRLKHLAGQLEARLTYLDLLRDFDNTWKHPQESATILERLLPLDPDNPLILLGLGESLLLLERPYEALDFLHKAVKSPATPARSFYVRGIAHLRLHLPTHAYDDFTRALELRPEKASWWRARGAARMVSDESEGMCEDFYQACALGDCEGLREARRRKLCLDSRRPIPQP